MDYIRMLVERAMALGEVLAITYDSKVHLYKVDINCVVHKEKKTNYRRALYGRGSTVSDACYDYLNKAAGGLMVQVITNKEIEG